MANELMLMGVGPSGASLAVPLALPGATALAYYRADTQAYSDAGATLATNGQTIRQWNDLSGNGRHLSQATALNRPAITLGATNYLAWDGTTSQMANAAIPIVVPITVASKIKLVNAGSNFQRVWRTVGSQDELAWARDNVSNSNGHFRTNGSASYLDFTPATDNFLTGFHGIVVGYQGGFAAAGDGTRVNTLHDSGGPDDGSAGTLDTTGFQLGDTFTAFQIQELVIYQGLLSAPNATALLAYFG